MPFWLLAGIAVGLSMDALAVAIGVSIKLRNTTPRQVFRLSFHFGLFQAMMPVLGWASGQYAAAVVTRFDHWVAFGLLSFIGGKAIREALSEKEAEERIINDPTRGMSLVSLSLATSMDAFAIGLSFGMLSVNVWQAIVVIGIVTGILTMLGMLFGSFLGRRFGAIMEVVGGLILIAIGLKILFDHLLK
ncbi:MAG: putative manganese efflux pump MntP [Candidatus Hydrogenedentes bacterium ADurb.Bin179]|nr:MAG: putative manganese efflux pump MntP [Candidatus Hydrogenedentes bacterium ADurb.Bin179]